MIIVIAVVVHCNSIRVKYSIACCPAASSRAAEVNVLYLVWLTGHLSSEIHARLAVSTDDTSRPNFIPPCCNCICEQ